MPSLQTSDVAPRSAQAAHVPVKTLPGLYELITGEPFDAWLERTGADA